MGFGMNKILIIILLLLTGASGIFAQQALKLDYAPRWSVKHPVVMERVAKPTLFLPPKKRNAKVSVGKALLFSLIVPGAGEYYVGNTFYAKTFFGIEIAAIAGMWANNVYHQSLVDDYQSYAVLHAGVNGAGKNEKYWVNLGKFDDIQTYNERRLNQRRINDIYAETAENSWRWDSVDNRFYYDFKRIKAAGVKNRNSYFFSAILINHLVSTINAVRLARGHNRSLGASASKLKVTFLGYRANDRFFGIALRSQF